MSLFWKNIGLWWRYGISRHCDEWKYIIIERIFESEIILIPPSLKISESSSNGSYRNTDEVWWRYGIGRSCDEWHAAPYGDHFGLLWWPFWIQWCLDQTLWNLVGISYAMLSCAFKGWFFAKWLPLQWKRPKCKKMEKHKKDHSGLLVDQKLMKLDRNNIHI